MTINDRFFFRQAKKSQDSNICTACNLAHAIEKKKEEKRR